MAALVSKGDMLRILMLAFSLFLFGCNSLPYQKLVIYSSPYGYEERTIDESNFEVSYYGKDGTSSDVFRAYLARRASELCEGDFKVSNITELTSISAHRQPVKLPVINGNVRCY